MPDVRPFNLPDRYFVHGCFNHAAHAQEKCSSCHKAETSKASADLLLPALATCRECHLGEDAVKAEVPSGCAMCHSYHVPGHVPGGPVPQDHPARRRDSVAILGRTGG